MAARLLYFSGSILNIGVRRKKEKHVASKSCRIVKEPLKTNYKIGEGNMPQENLITKVLDMEHMICEKTEEYPDTTTPQER